MLSSGSLAKQRSSKSTKSARRRLRKAKAKALNPAAYARNMRSAKDARWHVGLKNLKLPGVADIEGFEMGSGDNRRARMEMGIASAAVNPQRIMPRLTSTFKNGVQYDVLEGTDLIGSITTSGNNPGDVLFQVLLNPSTLGTTRITQFAPLYQRFRFEDVAIIYDSTQPSTAAGQLIGFCDYDPTVQLPDQDPQNLARAAAHQGQRPNQVWQPQEYPMSASPTYTDLFTDTTGSDPRLSYQGVFYLLAASALGDLGPLGNLYIRYRVLFSIPQLDTGVSSLPQTFFSSATGATGVSRTSDKPWNTMTLVRDQLSLTFPDTVNFRQLQFMVNPGWNVRIIATFNNGQTTGGFTSWAAVSSNQLINISTVNNWEGNNGSVWWIVVDAVSAVSAASYATVNLYPTLSSNSSGSAGYSNVCVLTWNPAVTGLRSRKRILPGSLEDKVIQLEGLIHAMERSQLELHDVEEVPCALLCGGPTGAPGNGCATIGAACCSSCNRVV